MATTGISNVHLLGPLRKAAAAAARGELEQGRKALAPIAGQVWVDAVPLATPLRAVAAGAAPSLGRRAFSVRLLAGAMRRDRFRCRYCDQRIVPRRVLVALSFLYPRELPYYEHYARGTVHPAYWLVAGEGDHLVPGSRGGSWIDPENIVTSCVRCNATKSNYLLEEIGWTLQAVRDGRRWDGLIGCYAGVCAGAGCGDVAYHRDMLAAFELATVAPPPRSAQESRSATPPWQVPAPRQRSRAVRAFDARLAEAEAAATEADRLLAVWAEVNGWQVKNGPSRSFVPPQQRNPATSGVRLAAESLARGPAVEFDLDALRRQGKDSAADQLHAALSRLAGRRVAAKFPSLACSVVVSDWDAVTRQVLEPYRRAHG